MKRFAIVPVIIAIALVFSAVSFANPEGSILKNSVENGFDLEFSGISFTEDRAGNADEAVLLSGDYYLKNDIGSLGTDIENSLALTLSAFVRIDSTPETYHHIMGLQRADGNYVALLEDAWDQYVLRAFQTGDTYSKTSYAGEFTVGAWKNVTITVGSGYAIIYVDGVEAGSFEADPMLVFSNIKYFSVGTPAVECTLDPNRKPFNGAVDDIKIYTSALSATDVASLAAGNDVGTPAAEFGCDKSDVATDDSKAEESKIVSEPEESVVESKAEESKTEIEADTLLNGVDGAFDLYFEGASFIADREGNADGAMLLGGSYTMNSEITAIGAKLKESQALTLSAFVRVDSSPESYHHIFSMQRPDGTYAAMLEDAWDQYVLRAYQTGDTYSKTAYAGEFTVGAWKNITITIGYGYAILYIDGVESASFEADAALLFDDVRYFSVGAPATACEMDPNRAPFNGAVDDIKIYTSALSADEVALLAAGSNVGTPAASFSCDKYDTESEKEKREESSEESVEESSEESTEESSEESTEESSEESTEESSEVSTEESVEESSEVSTEESVEESSEVSTEESVEESSEVSIEESVEESSEVSTEDSSEVSTEDSSEVSVEASDDESNGGGTVSVDTPSAGGNTSTDPGVDPTGDSGVYAVLMLCLAAAFAAAITIRKKKYNV